MMTARSAAHKRHCLFIHRANYRPEVEAEVGAALVAPARDARGLGWGGGVVPCVASQDKSTSRQTQSISVAFNGWTRRVLLFQ